VTAAPGGARLRVLHSVPSVGDTFGGVAASVLSLGRVEGWLGRDATLLTVDRPEQGRSLHSELARRFDLRIVPAGPLAGRYHGGRQVHAMLRSLIPQQDLVVFHSVFDFLTLVGHRVALRNGVPYVIWPHGSLDPYDLVKHARAKRALAPAWRSMIAGAQALVCTTQQEVDRLHTFGASPRRVVAVPLLPDRAEQPGDSERARRRLGLGPGSRVVLFLGRIDAKKGLPLLLDGFDRAWRDGDELVVAGSGEPAYERQVRAHAAGLPHADHVRFTGWVTGADKADLLAAADLLALISENENFGHSVAEALAVGTAVLLSRDVFLAEQLVPAGAAAVCERTPASVAAGLRDLLDDTAGRERMGAAARDFVTRTLDIGRIARGYAGVGAGA
jgi:glycosyltransferase involved in cell wall biosynthesis